MLEPASHQLTKTPNRPYVIVKVSGYPHFQGIGSGVLMAGRPRKLDPVTANKIVDDYLASHPDTPTISGCALSLGVDIQTISNWSHEGKGPFFGLATKLVSTCYAKHEERLYDSKGGAAAGSIFWLKAHGLSDQPSGTKVEAVTVPEGGIKVTITGSGNAAGVDV